MYRAITPLVLLATITAAPQDTTVPKDAEITYIKMQPNTGDPIPAPSYRSSLIEIPPLTIGSSEKQNEDDILETSEDDSRNVVGRTEEPTTVDFESAETTEAVTEKYEAKTTPSEQKTSLYETRTTVYEPKTKVPRFHSKLSYFEKPNDNSLLSNLVERPGRRKFRSRCRCERISNCPKLQITVPRCPEEQFLCCF